MARTRITARSLRAMISAGAASVRMVEIPEDGISRFRRNKLLRDVHVAHEYLTHPKQELHDLFPLLRKINMSVKSWKYKGTPNPTIKWVSIVVNSGLKYMLEHGGVTFVLPDESYIEAGLEPPKRKKLRGRPKKR